VLVFVLLAVAVVVVVVVVLVLVVVLVVLDVLLFVLVAVAVGVLVLVILIVGAAIRYKRSQKRSSTIVKAIPTTTISNPVAGVSSTSASSGAGPVEIDAKDHI